MISYRIKDGVATPLQQYADGFLQPWPHVTSWIGSGGKSSLLRAMALACAANGQTVVITTTTHIQPIHNYIDDKETALANLPRDRIVTIADPLTDGKLRRPGDSVFTRMLAEADVVLVEADGSKRLPLKFPAAHEPQIHPDSGLIVLVAGLSALGKRLDDVCHRSELASAALEITPKTVVTSDVIVNLLLCGYLQNLWQHACPVHVALNQVDTDAQIAAGSAIAAQLLALAAANGHEHDFQVTLHHLAPDERIAT